MSTFNNTDTPNINNIDFQEVWYGSASDKNSMDFEDLKKQIIKCQEDLELFVTTLELKEKYIELENKIMRLQNEINSCSCRNRDDGGECRNCFSRLESIRQYNSEREKIYTEISNILSKFDIILPEYQSIVSIDYSSLNTGSNISFPLYNQNDYEHISYGLGNIKDEGCGITCAAMVISAYTGQNITPDILAETIQWDGNNTTLSRALDAYGIRNANNNSLQTGFEDSPEDFNNYYQIKEKIENGYVAIFQMNKGNFTGNGHFILVTGITEDGRLLVNDPNGDNYTYNSPDNIHRTQVLQNGFENGFEDSDFLSSGQWSGCYLIEPYDTYIHRTEVEGV